MPHVALVPFTGFRIRAAEMLALGMRLPGLAKRGKALGELPSLGLLTLAGTNPEHWSASYHPSATAGKRLLEQVLARRPDLVAISALSASVEEAYALSREVRAHGIPTVIGGLHATACPDEAVEQCSAVVVGHGESVWPDVLADAETGRLRAIYQAVPSTGPGEWPLPRFDLLGEKPPRFTIQTERGCPLACEFCAASRLLGRFQEKPTTNLARELEFVSRYARRPMVELADDNTFVGTRDFGAFLDVLTASGARWFTESDWRLGERPEVLAKLARAGCVQVLVGIESLVFRYPGQGAKWNDLRRIMQAVAAIQAAGVVVNGCFIVGADGETRDSLSRLMEFVLASPLAEVQVTLQTPFPGTMLRERLVDTKRLIPERGWPHYTLFDLTYEPDTMSIAELERGFRDVLSAIYSKAASARREKIRREIYHTSRNLRWASRRSPSI